MHLHTIRQVAINELEELVEKWSGVSDAICELADSHCPVYYWDILEIASRNIYFALEMPECWPAYWVLNPVNLIHANIYEYLVQELRWAYNSAEEE